MTAEERLDAMAARCVAAEARLVPCPCCGGEGAYYGEECEQCRGEGRLSPVEARRALAVMVRLGIHPEVCRAC